MLSRVTIVSKHNGLLGVFNRRHLCFGTADSARKAREPGSPPPADEHVEGEDSTRNHESKQAAEGPAEAHEPAIGPAEGNEGEGHEGGITETDPMAVDEELRDGSGEKDEEDKVGTRDTWANRGGGCQAWACVCGFIRDGLLTNGSRGEWALAACWWCDA
jgi:hypothetical protein